MEEALSIKGDGILCPVAVIVRNGKVLTGLRRYTKDKWKDISVWTIPGGRTEIGETTKETLTREIAEEVGITEFEIVALIGKANGAKRGDKIIMFHCTTEQQAKCMEPEKFSEWKWIPLSEYIENEEYNSFNPSAKKIIRNYLKNLN